MYCSVQELNRGALPVHNADGGAGAAGGNGAGGGDRRGDARRPPRHLLFTFDLPERGGGSSLPPRPEAPNVAIGRWFRGTRRRASASPARTRSRRFQSPAPVAAGLPRSRSRLALWPRGRRARAVRALASRSRQLLCGPARPKITVGAGGAPLKLFNERRMGFSRPTKGPRGSPLLCSPNPPLSPKEFLHGLRR